MIAPSSARQALRRQTASDHDRVDQAYSTFDLRSRAGYRAFLRAQADPFLAVEAAIDRFDPAAILPDWPTRRRADLLREDLSDLGEPEPDPALLEIGAAERALGAIYVLEGSRLGGAMLARSVPPDLPGRFIRSTPAPQRWRTLIGLLDEHLVTPMQRDAAVDAAKEVFALFANSAERQKRTNDVE
ncbi:biliverdin-producing heme oxygenase [Sphingomonas suaedae]|uniref:Biliverdin-producing heme oxygenase n=1 Tax=Sphingomonas suaedae TaxID=2599297 RepID=A0A518RGX7_9SPHN|nr:biliverdin-producing heme oxygenase [Sphingomonas suaedae]QDX26659.1 biliverdin-producing heme oxygenase [Sphingomonas suaedae]